MYYVEQVLPRGSVNTLCTSDLRKAIKLVKGMTFMDSTAIIFTIDEHGTENILEDPS